MQDDNVGGTLELPVGPGCFLLKIKHLPCCSGTDFTYSLKFQFAALSTSCSKLLGKTRVHLPETSRLLQQNTLNSSAMLGCTGIVVREKSKSTYKDEATSYSKARLFPEAMALWTGTVGHAYRFSGCSSLPFTSQVPTFIYLKLFSILLLAHGLVFLD